MTIPRPRILLLPLAALLAAVSACQDGTGPRAGPPAVMDIVDGNAQEGIAGAELPNAVVVRVTDDRGRPVRGQLVNFRVTAGGGSVFAGSALTNNEGIARERWTLGTVAGAAQSLEARAVDQTTGQALVFATFTATAKAGAPARISALDNDTTVSGVVGSLVADSLAVVVRDQNDNLVPGATVTWAVLTGGGSIAAIAATTDAAGVARARWTLGAEAIAQHRAQAAVGSAGPVRFTALVASTLQVTTAPPSSGVGGSTVPVSVRATGPTGDGVPDLAVQWAAAGGAVNPVQSRTGATGVAQTVWTWGAAGGTQTLTASSALLSHTFTATVTRSGTRTLLATVPGTVLDADGTRVLWGVQTPEGSYHARLRQDGVDVTIATGSGDAFSGALFPGGALVRRQGPGFTFTLVEHRNGASQDLGPVYTYAVDGSWAAWAVNQSGPILRRNLSTGATDTVLPASAGIRRIALDAGPNGDVAYSLYYGGNGGGPATLARYRDGTHTQYFNDFSYGPLNPRTDGTSILFTVATAPGPIELRLVEGAGSRVLSSSASSAAPPHPGGVVEGGWVAYNHILPGTSGPTAAYARLITPAGADQPVQSRDMVHVVEALAPNGALAYQGAVYSSGWTRTRHFITPAGSGPSDVGPIASDDRVIYAGGRFLLLSGGSVYELTP